MTDAPPFAPGDRARVKAPHLLIHGREVVVRSVLPLGETVSIVTVTPENAGRFGGQWSVFADELEALVPPERARPLAVGDRAAMAPRGEG